MNFKGERFPSNQKVVRSSGSAFSRRFIVSNAHLRLARVSKPSRLFLRFELNRPYGGCLVDKNLLTGFCLTRCFLYSFGGLNKGFYAINVIFILLVGRTLFFQLVFFSQRLSLQVCLTCCSRRFFLCTGTFPARLLRILRFSS